MTGLRTNERLLHTILNEVWPNQWVNEHKGIEAEGIYKSGVREGKSYKRRFSFDCANPALKIAIEIEGGIWINGGHNRPIGYQNNMEKYNLAVLEGWKVLRYSPECLKKTPYKIIRDVRMLCGASSPEAGQTVLCFDDASTGVIQVQRKL